MLGLKLTPLLLERAKYTSTSGVPSVRLGSFWSLYQTMSISPSEGSTAMVGQNWLKNSPAGFTSSLTRIGAAQVFPPSSDRENTTSESSMPVGFSAHTA